MDNSTYYKKISYEKEQKTIIILILGLLERI